jgi:hypothetical protein
VVGELEGKVTATQPSIPPPLPPTLMINREPRLRVGPGDHPTLNLMVLVIIGGGGCTGNGG